MLKTTMSIALMGMLLGACERERGPFDANHVIEVNVELSPEQWDTLRHEGRNAPDALSGCAREYAYTYFDATVTVDGETYTDVAIRKKGFLGSLSAMRPSLKINFGKFVEGRTHAGMKRMTLNNNFQDASNARQCMTYDLFAKAGVVAPRCNFAKVTVNGEELGIYTHVESIKKPMLSRHFEDNDGNLYEGQGGDFTASRLEIMQLKTNETENDRSDLEAVANALQADDDELLDALGQVIDVDNFLSFWAMEVLTGHWDSYSGGRNNYLTYHDPTTDRFFFIPWGADGSFSNARIFSGENRNPAVLAEGEIANRLYEVPETRALYFERLDTLFSELWDEEELLAESERIEALTGATSSVMRSQRNFITSQTTELRAALDDRENAGEWIRSASADEALKCRPELVTPISGSFSTQWSNALMPKPGGDQALDITINGETWQPSSLMSGAGSESGAPDSANILLVSMEAGQKLTGIVLKMPKQNLRVGEHPMHGLETGALFIELNTSSPSQAPRVLGFAGKGRITLEQASTEVGT
ncbi:MAG TPA: hypothetical protein DCG25_10325, partial [Acidimicrobiaceae bacterium]|nr:hypothetical protein [Acidimicrobiaceae bacterium]